MKSTLITAILEEMTVYEIEKTLDDLGLSYERGGDREYPDLTISGADFGNELVAFDIKTCRLKGVNSISGFTLGSRAGYFRNPDVKMRGCKRPYNEFTRHVIVGLIYKWEPAESSVNMVDIRYVVVAEKWRLASKSTGTGTTKHIGSVRDLDRILRKEGDFQSIDDFEYYWRNYD